MVPEPPPCDETLDDELALLEILETDEELILEDEELETELEELVELVFAELLELTFDELVEDDETEDGIKEDIKDDVEEIMDELDLLDKDEFTRLDELDFDEGFCVTDVAILLEDRVAVDELELDRAWLEKFRDDATELLLPSLFVSPEPAPQAAKPRVNIESQAIR